MKQLSLIIIILIQGIQAYAQENVFLDRSYWDTKPTIEMVDLKIKEGNDISQSNENAFDGVVYAILQKAPNATIKYIQSKPGNDINKLTHDGRTYIFWAAYAGNDELMTYFIGKGAKTDLVDDHGSTILNFAASSGQTNTKVYDICLANGANLQKDLNQNGANALLLAAPSDKDFTLINYFVSKGLSLQDSKDSNGNGVFNYVARTGNIPLLKQLQEKGVKGTDQAFSFASQGGRGSSNGLEVYKFLESIGLNPNVVTKEGATPIHALASGNDNLPIFEYFINKGVDVNLKNAEGNNALMIASTRNKIEVIKLLLSKTTNINEVNTNGSSALTHAVSGNKPEVVEFLIKNKADVLVKDKNGNNLVPYAISSFSPTHVADFEAKLKLLESNGLNITTAQENGNTLYHLAVNNGNLDLLKQVSKFGVDVNAKNKEGMTLLHLAAMKAKDTETLKYLISIGAKKEVKTEFDETAYDLASENELLKQNKSSIEFLK